MVSPQLNREDGNAMFYLMAQCAMTGKGTGTILLIKYSDFT